MCGTLGYIAPEIYAGQAATVRSDIYSFGAVLWQLCTGSQRPPFWEALRDVAADAYAASAILSRSQLSPVQSIFWTVIGRCLRLDPNDRYQDFDEVKNGIRTVLDQAGHRKLDFVVNTAPAFDNLVNRGASLRTLGRFDEALACYDAAIQLKPNAAAVWVNKGNLHSSMKHPAEAMQAYDHAIQLDPTCQLAWFNKGIQLQHNNENAEAIRCFDRLIELNPQHSLAWNRKGRSLVAQDEIEKAMACHRKALEINPNDEIACTYLAECLFQIGSKAQSLRYYDRAIEANSKHRDAWIGKAELLIELTRFDEALRCLDFALMLNSDDLATVNMKAIVLCRSGRQREAIPLFDMLLANSTTDMDVLWANKGNALAELGKWSDALSCYDRALAVNPNYAPARSQHDLVVRELKSSS
jgi:tetratricopeptide (TPR) repeat protein